MENSKIDERPPSSTTSTPRMRLIDTSTLELKHFANDDEVTYAILSHRWEDDEPSLQEFVSGEGVSKKGFLKIRAACAE